MVVWDDDDEFYEAWGADEIRYRIDRGQMRLTPPPKKRRLRLAPNELMCKVCGKPRQLKCGCPRPGALKPEEWGSTRVRSTLTQSSSDDSMELSIDRHPAGDELKGVTPMAAKADPLSAKEAAAQLGTDARTLRKFLRKRSGLVGQGNRWEIDPKEIKALKKEFDEWAKGARSESKPKVTEPPADDDLTDIDDAIEEITDDELEELDA